MQSISESTGPDFKEDVDYAVKQVKHAREYDKAWAEAPQEFKEAAKAAGLSALPDKPHGGAIAFNDNFQTSSYNPDMAESIDTQVDELIEKHGVNNKCLVLAVIEDLRKPMLKEIEMHRALMIARVVGYMIQGENSNMLASAHSLMHAIPRFAGANGFGSLRASAKAAGVSVEWIRKTRNKWCEILCIPIPAEGSKSDDAKEKYRKAATNSHWRHQTWKGKETL